jgi:hypothetical protein
MVARAQMCDFRSLLCTPAVTQEVEGEAEVAVCIHLGTIRTGSEVCNTDGCISIELLLATWTEMIVHDLDLCA